MEGDSVYLVSATTSSDQAVSGSNLTDIYVLNSDSGSAFKYFFKRQGDTVAQIPTGYAYYFTDSELADETLIGRLDSSFVMENGIPMHRGVVGTYRIAGEMNRKTLATN